LYDPHWTLHAAAEQEYDGVSWVPQYQAGSRKPPSGRDAVRTELARTFEPLPGYALESGT
jgi:anthraniloyl-CoA monooxygenase